MEGFFQFSDRPYFHGIWWMLSAICWLAGPYAVAAPITSNTALPIHEGEILVRGQARLIRSSDDSGPQNRELTVWAAPTVIVYGVSPKFTLFGIVPYLDKSLALTTSPGRITRGDAGIGDVTFLTRFTLGQWDRPGETLRLAPFLGLEIPTGRDDAVDSLGPLPRPLQLGSGSWDPIIGTIFSWQRLAWQFDASAAYKLNTEAGGFEFRDEARFDLSFQYRLRPRELDSGTPNYLYGVIESTLRRQGRNHSFGQTIIDSGGTTWFVAPGIQYVTKRIILEAAVQIPVIQDLNGNTLENDFIFTGGFRFAF